MYMERQKLNHLWKIIEWENSVYWIQDKVCRVKAMVFPAIMYRCKSWSIKKTECQRTDAFKLWCWRRLLRAPWTARKSNQTILKEINPEYSLEGLMLKLKLQYSVHLRWRADSQERFPFPLMLGKIEGRRKIGQERMRRLDNITDSMDVSLSKLQEMVKDREPRNAAGYRVTKSRTQLSYWKTTHSNPNQDCVALAETETYNSVGQNR